MTHEDHALKGLQNSGPHLCKSNEINHLAATIMNYLFPVLFIVAGTVGCILFSLFPTFLKGDASPPPTNDHSHRSLNISGFQSSSPPLDRFHRLLNVSGFVSHYPGMIGLNDKWNITSSSFCAGLKEYNTPIIVDTLVSGLTNQLMSNQQSLFISTSLGLPFESMGFLDVGCYSAWTNCPINAIVPISDVFDLDSLSMKLGISWTQASKNYCYRHTFPANLSMNQLTFNASMFSIKGRTVVTPGWARYRTYDTSLSWRNFTKALHSSLNHRILYHCHAILKALPPFHCIHPRVDADYIDKYDIGRKIILKDSNNVTTFYIVMRENSRHMYPQSKVYSKYHFGNFSGNVRSLMMDACICSNEKALMFSGSAGSSFSMLIASFRTAVGLSSTLYGASLKTSFQGKPFQNPWYDEYYGRLNIEEKPFVY